MTERPHTPYNRRLFAAASDSLMGRPPAEVIIDRHITMAGPFEIGPYDADADASFRAFRSIFRDHKRARLVRSLTRHSVTGRSTSVPAELPVE